MENVKHLKGHNKGWTYKIIRNVLEKELQYEVFDKIIDARFLVSQHRERIFIVGFANPRLFNFPTFEIKQQRLRDILEDNVDPKYTLSNQLWDYLKKYAEKHKAKGNGFGYGLSNLDGVSRTLSARYYKDGSEILIPQKGKNPRRLTPRECARLMGFPETFKIPVSDTQAYKQFGNSVVVSVIERIAKKIVDFEFGKKLNSKIKSIELR